MEPLLPNSKVCIVGRCKTGKTTWAKHILSGTRVDVFTPFSSEWKNTPYHIHPKDVDVLHTVLMEQKELVENWKQNSHRREIPMSLRLWLVFDDCAVYHEFMESEDMKSLADTDNLGVSVLFVVQYLDQLHESNLKSLDYLGVLSCSHLVLKKTHSKFLKPILKEKDWFILANESTADRGMCWINIPKKRLSHVQIRTKRKVTRRYPARKRRKPTKFSQGLTK